MKQLIAQFMMGVMLPWLLGMLAMAAIILPGPEPSVGRIMVGFTVYIMVWLGVFALMWRVIRRER